MKFLFTVPHTAQSNSPWNIFTGMPLQMQRLCCGLACLCQSVNHAIECVKGVSTQDKLQHVFFKSHIQMRWAMVMLFNCIGHQEVDLVKFVKYLWSFIEDHAKFIFFFSPQPYFLKTVKAV